MPNLPQPRRSVGRTTTIGWLAAASAVAVAVSAATPRLLLPGFSGNGVSLGLTGDAGARYRIEGSTNLVQWFTVSSGVATNGTFSTRHEGPITAGTVYYRGVQEGGGAPFPSVVPKPGTNLIASSVILPDSGGTLRLVTPERVTYTLQFPTNSFTDPTLVTLTPLTQASGFPSAQGWLAGVRLEPAGQMPLSPVFLQIEFPTNIPARQVSSVAFDNDGARLHLVPDVVVSNGPTNRVRILVNQLRSHGCGVFTLPELQALAGTTPPPRVTARRAGLHSSMQECYPDDETEARDMQEELEDRIRPFQQAAAATLGEERQRQLLGVVDESGGNSALARVMEDSEVFYTREIKSRVDSASQKCALTQTLLPWVLGHDRQRALLGGGDSSDGSALQLLCQGSKTCQDQAIQCCRSQGGDTRLIQSLLGVARQRQLLGAGPECGEISVDETIKECAPPWYGTLSVRIRGRYLFEETVGGRRVRRSRDVDQVITASVLSAKVKVNEASIFAPAYTNIQCVLGGQITASDVSEKLQQDFSERCGDLPISLRRDVWASSLSTNINDIKLEALLLEPGTGGFFLFPYLRLSGDGVRDMRWTWVEEQSHPSEFSDEPCVTERQTGGNYDPDAGQFGISVYATEGQFTYTEDSIRYSFKGPEQLDYDFNHPYEGTKEIELELHRVR